MRWGVAMLAVCAVLAAPATASAPTLTGLQKQMQQLRLQVAVLSGTVATLQQQVIHDEDVTRCGDAIQADNLNGTWHTLVLLGQYNGFPAEPDYPRFDDGGACARLGIARSR